MTKHAQMNLLFHGTVILFASMLTGVPLGSHTPTAGRRKRFTPGR